MYITVALRIHGIRNFLYKKSIIVFLKFVGFF